MCCIYFRTAWKTNMESRSVPAQTCEQQNTRKITGNTHAAICIKHLKSINGRMNPSYWCGPRCVRLVAPGGLAPRWQIAPFNPSCFLHGGHRGMNVGCGVEGGLRKFTVWWNQESFNFQEPLRATGVNVTAGMNVTGDGQCHGLWICAGTHSKHLH